MGGASLGPPEQEEGGAAWGKGVKGGWGCSLSASVSSECTSLRT